ncbi:MAG TPA: sigma-70 family RNA polymerase sigma factor [Pirellulales bacterium]|nr:sigma-70 family RNA polymerase sigma factor [Pirellulales bacterium]
MPSSDAELVQAACAGDIDGFRKLYERYYKMAVGIARSRLNDQHLAEDAAQEAFAIACRRLSLLRNTSRFPEWLGTICRRVATKMGRSRNGHIQTMTADPIAQTDNDTGPGEEIHQALDRLSDAEREILYLHYFSGLSYDEIAAALGISHQAVHGRLQRARRQLASKLATLDTEGRYR